MRLPIVFLIGSISLLAQSIPAGIRVSTWVREDLFAGFLQDDMPRFEQGMKKVDEVIKGNAMAADAWAWRGGGELFLAVRAYESGNRGEFDALWRRSKASFQKSREIAEKIKPYADAYNAIGGGSFALFADRLPMEFRGEGWKALEQHYSDLKTSQNAVFSKMPAHHQGEVLAGLALAAQRTGQAELANQRLRGIVESLPKTPYAVFAQRWLDRPESAASTKIVCLSCHDPGRLEPMLKSVNQAR